MRKRFLLVLAVLAFVATACPADDVIDTDLPYAGVEIVMSASLAEEEIDTIRDLLDEFRGETGASVDLAAIESEQLPERLRVDVDAARPTIHLFAQDNLALRVLVDDGLVQDVGDVDIPGGVIEAMIPEQFDGVTYFLPFRPNVRVAYANDARFEEAGVELPTTHEEFRSVAEAFQQATGEGKVTLSLAEGDPAAVTISEWIVSFGGDPVILNDDGSVAAFEFLQEMWQDGLLAEESLTGQFDTEVDYLRGEIAWLAQNWPFTSAVFEEEGLLDRFTVFKGWDGPDRGAHVIGGDVLGIPTGVDGEEREVAVELAQFLMDREAQEALAARNAWPSIREDAYADVPAEQQETFDAIQAALEDGWYRPNVAYWPDVSDAMNTAIRRVIQGGEDAQTVLDEMHEEVAAAAERHGVEYPPS